MTDLIKEFFITKDFTILIVFLVIFIIYFIKNKIFKNFIQWIIKRTPSRLDNDLFPIIDQLINATLILSGIFVILINLGINANVLTAMCGAITLGLSLVIKDSLANIMAGFTIVLDKPFVVGNQIKLSSGELVTVEEIGLRCSKFNYQELCDKDTYLPHYNTVILIIPNSHLLKDKIYNYSYGVN